MKNILAMLSGNIKCIQKAIASSQEYLKVGEDQRSTSAPANSCGHKAWQYLLSISTKLLQFVSFWESYLWHFELLLLFQGCTSTYLNNVMHDEPRACK